MVNYETGIKWELMNRKATLDLAVFKIHWSDMQIEIQTHDTKISYTVNAGKVTSEGFEFAATYWPEEAMQPMRMHLPPRRFPPRAFFWAHDCQRHPGGQPRRLRTTA
jgi:hypothetical protein